MVLLLPVMPLTADLQQLNKQASQSVVLLKVYDAAGLELKEGTGFVVESGAIVTNHHVARGASRIDALTADQQVIGILGLLADDEKNDLALLKTVPHRLPLLPLATRKIEVGERVVVLGNPEGLASTLSEGIVSAIRPEGVGSGRPGDKDTGPLLQISAPISSGSSGSPVLDLAGQVIGVVSSSYDTGQNLNFAIPVDAVARLLAASKSGKLLQPLQSQDKEKSVILRNLGISAAFFILLLVAFRFFLRAKSGTPEHLN